MIYLIQTETPELVEHTHKKNKNDDREVLKGRDPS